MCTEDTELCETSNFEGVPGCLGHQDVTHGRGEEKQTEPVSSVSCGGQRSIHEGVGTPEWALRHCRNRTT